MSKNFKEYIEYIKTFYLLESKNRIFSEKIAEEEYDKKNFKN